MGDKCSDTLSRHFLESLEKFGAPLSHSLTLVAMGLDSHSTSLGIALNHTGLRRWVLIKAV